MITMAQYFKIYELLQKHFKNEADAKTLVTEIEGVIENRFSAEKDRLSSKEDIFIVREDIARLKTRVEQNFKNQLKWTIILMFGFSTLIITVIKLL